MSAPGLLDRRVRARKDEDDSVEELESGSSADEAPSEVSLGAGGSEHGSDEDDNDEDDDSNADDDTDQEEDDASPAPSAHAALADISFGALASAAATLPPSKKRKRANGGDRTSANRSPSPFHEAAERQAGKKLSAQATRSSKHAPSELSSKRAVSRKRVVIPVAAAQPRDPRFAATSGGVDANKVDKNYSFLNEYRASEIADLKKQMRTAKTAQEKDRLKAQVRTMEDRERARKRMEEQKAVIGEHRKSERERVKEGKQPYFLKKGEVKRQVLVKRFEGMGEKSVEKAMERRRKKKASKEKRSMPMERRVVGE